MSEDLQLLVNLALIGILMLPGLALLEFIWGALRELREGNKS